MPKTRYEIETDALTLKGLIVALDALTWEGHDPEKWGSVTALIRTINKQAIELSEAIARQPEQS